MLPLAASACNPIPVLVVYDILFNDDYFFEVRKTHSNSNSEEVIPMVLWFMAPDASETSGTDGWEAGFHNK